MTFSTGDVVTHRGHTCHIPEYFELFCEGLVFDTSFRNDYFFQETRFSTVLTLKKYVPWHSGHLNRFLCLADMITDNMDQLGGTTMSMITLNDGFEVYYNRAINLVSFTLKEDVDINLALPEGMSFNIEPVILSGRKHIHIKLSDSNYVEQVRDWVQACQVLSS